MSIFFIAGIQAEGISALVNKPSGLTFNAGIFEEFIGNDFDKFIPFCQKPVLIDREFQSDRIGYCFFDYFCRNIKTAQEHGRPI